MQLLMYRLSMMFLKMGPRSFHYFLGRRFIDLWLFFCSRDLHIVQNNIKHIATQRSFSMSHKLAAKQTFYHFARYWVDFFSSRDLTLSQLNQWMRFEGFEYLDEALARGNGVIALTGHVGNWELGGLALGLKGYPVSAVALDHANSQINEMFIQQRESKGVKVIPLGGAARKCMKVLREKNMVALLGDRIFDTREKGVRVKFFDGGMQVPRGPAMLSLKTGAPLVPCFILMQEDGGYVYRIYPPIELTVDEDASDDEKMADLMQSYANLMESVVAKYPLQWFAFQNIWKD